MNLRQGSVWVFYNGSISTGLDAQIESIATKHNLKWEGQGSTTIKPIERDISFGYFDISDANKFITKIKGMFGEIIRTNLSP